jgi:hypothetical protein
MPLGGLYICSDYYNDVIVWIIYEKVQSLYNPLQRCYNTEFCLEIGQLSEYQTVR